MSDARPYTADEIEAARAVYCDPDAIEIADGYRLPDTESCVAMGRRVIATYDQLRGEVESLTDALAKKVNDHYETFLERNEMSSEVASLRGLLEKQSDHVREFRAWNNSDRGDFASDEWMQEGDALLEKGAGIQDEIDKALAKDPS